MDTILQLFPSSFWERRDDGLNLEDLQPKNVLVQPDGRIRVIDVNYTTGNPTQTLAFFLLNLDVLAIRWPSQVGPRPRLIVEKNGAGGVRAGRFGCRAVAERPDVFLSVEARSDVSTALGEASLGRTLSSVVLQQATKELSQRVVPQPYPHLIELFALKAHNRTRGNAPFHCGWGPLDI